MLADATWAPQEFHSAASLSSVPSVSPRMDRKRAKPELLHPPADTAVGTPAASLVPAATAASAALGAEAGSEVAGAAAGSEPAVLTTMVTAKLKHGPKPKPKPKPGLKPGSTRDKGAKGDRPIIPPPRIKSKAPPVPGRKRGRPKGSDKAKIEADIACCSGSGGWGDSGVSGDEGDGATLLMGFISSVNRSAAAKCDH